ncbi:hypothetical protein CU024_0671 [Enterococcus faecium]|nr:hypothetical protein [Enterococcus faecium]
MVSANYSFFHGFLFKGIDQKLLYIATFFLRMFFEKIHNGKAS